MSKCLFSCNARRCRDFILLWFMRVVEIIYHDDQFMTQLNHKSKTEVFLSFHTFILNEISIQTLRHIQLEIHLSVLWK